MQYLSISFILIFQMVDAWITCNSCGYRYSSFIPTCPKCTHQNSGSVTHNYKNRRIVRKGIIITTVTITAAIAVFLMIPNASSFILGSNNSKDTPAINRDILAILAHPKFTNNDLKQFALQKINEDRKKYNLAPVELRNNEAAQFHAEDVLKTRQISHWMTNGEKPYMTYTRYGGLGAVAQNVDVQGFSNSDIVTCTSGLAICGKIDPFKGIDRGEYAMMYEDKVCCNDGHRDNILDKHHTSVSLGIAYNDYYFVMVQNFEDNYIQFTKPLLADNRHVQLAGSLISGGKFDVIGVYYDKTPTPMVYEENKDKTSYSLGEHIATVVEPIWMGKIYKPTGNEAIVYSDSWSINDKGLNIKFDLSQVVKRSGVYTVVVFLRDINGSQFPATTYSVFVTDANDDY